MLGPLRDYLKEGVLPIEKALRKWIKKVYKEYYIEKENGALMHKGHYSRKRSSRGGIVGECNQLVIPKTLRQAIFTDYHDSVLGGGNLGFSKTYQKIADRFFWPTMRAEIDHQVRHCYLCNIRKPMIRNPKPPLNPIPVPDVAFEMVVMDILGPLPITERGNEYVLVITDYLTRWPEAFALKDTKAETIANVLVDEIICRYGCPRVILSDRGRNLMAELIKNLCKIF
jgi:hypothetical protein